MRLSLAIILTIWLFFSGGAAAAAPSPGVGLLQEGIFAFEQGQYEEALSLFRGYVIRNPQAKDLTQAYYFLAKIFLAGDELPSARLYFERIPADERTAPVRFIEAQLLLGEGASEQALASLMQLSPEELPGDDRIDWYLATAQALFQTGRELQSLAILNSGVQLHGAASSRTLLKLAHQIGAGLSGEVLAEGAFMLQGGPVGLDLELYLARAEFASGNSDDALRRTERIIASRQPFLYRQEAALLYDRLRGRPWIQRAIGVLLPESGRLAAFGELLKRGVELARELHDQESEPVKLIYRDTGGDPGLAEEAVRKLANEDRVMAILGPISGAAAESAAHQAEVEGVPMLSLSQRDGIPEIGPQVFRVSLTDRNQAAELARYAIDELGMDSFGVLYPETAFGHEMLALFSQEVLKRNGLVVDSESYPNDATDFRSQIRLLMGEDPNQPVDFDDLPEEEQLEALFEPEFPPVCFDALLIPDYADRVALIAPQLPFYGMEKVPLLGINGWNQPELVRNAGRAVEGAIFVDGFFRHSSYPFVRDFVDLYFATYGEEPTILEAQGFDAANILFSLLDQAWIADRDSLREALSRYRDYPGVTGATSFNAVGDAEKQLYILQVHRGSVQQLN